MFIRNESFFQYIKNYPVISIIILLQFVLYMMNFIPFIPHKYIIQFLTGVNLYIAEGEYRRLITPIFIHLHFSHLLMNSFSLILFGPFLERMLGKWAFCLFFLACGIIGNIATFLILPLTYQHIGSSGAIFGIFGIYLSILLLKRSYMQKRIQQTIIPIIIIAFIMSFFEENVNYTSHLCGMGFGCLLGVLYFNLLKKN